MDMFLWQPVIQVAYVVLDAEKAARDHARAFGSGPFFVIDRGVSAAAWYRGAPVDFGPTVALGQCGNVMIELLQSNDDRPSMLNELVPRSSGRSVVHHLCYNVADFGEALDHMESRGFDTVFRAEMLGGTHVAISDTSRINGHYIEFHEKTGEISALYDTIGRAAQGYDGRDPVRPMNDLFSSIS